MTDDPELKRNNDRETRFFRREMLVVIIIVGLFILVGAIWTAINGPAPIPGAVDAQSVPESVPRGPG